MGGNELQRDFSHEHPLNILFRAMRALTGRFVAGVFRLVGLFGGMGRGSYFGRGARLLNPKLVFLGDRVCFGVGARIECFGAVNVHPKIRIGSGTTFGDYVHLGCANGIDIGQNVLFGSQILVIDHSHGRPSQDIIAAELVAPSQRDIVSKGKIVVGDNVWVADGVTILAGADIGAGAIIGAGAVVRGNVAARSIFLG